MPLLKITTSANASPEHPGLLATLSRWVAEQLGKPESYMQTLLEHSALMTFGGTREPTAYVEVKSVGHFRPELTLRLSAELCERIGSALGVAKNRIYIEFSDAQGYMWGHDGRTFG